MKVPNLPKSAGNQVSSAVAKAEDEHGKTKLLRFTS